ncbi:MAG: hypothetical protein A2X78_05160 [Gammaproteobacteria bacterium GWE2_37_16]|nr:MAG: hypothetical protein A2X78_05160 [Gammaproteobacteria bacterium GWE2_37_16]
MRVAKLFQNGQSMAVRLPKDFRFLGTEVSISRVGDAVILQPIHKNWLGLYDSMYVLKDFMETRGDLPPEEREDA